jgi:peptidoglycan hydrolase-like protein with peptidoglycan-binding domain
LLVALLLCLPGMSQAGTAVAQAAEANQATKAPLALGSGYGRPSGSARVRTLQQRLRTLGHKPGPVDGLYGPLTEAAVERFQSTAGLAVDGIAGPHTLRRVRAEWPPPIGRSTGYGGQDGSAQVRAVQRHLRTLNQNPGPVDGVFGPRTEAAVMRFQSDTGLAADGVVGSHTWRALERARTRYAARRHKTRTVRRALASLAPQTGSGRSALVLSRLPSDETGGHDLDLLALFLIVAAAFAAAAFAHAFARRRAFAGQGRAVAVPVGGLLPGARAHRPADRAGTRPRRPAQQDTKEEPSSQPRNPSPPPFSGTALAEIAEARAVQAVGYVSGADPRSLTGAAVTRQIAAIDEACAQRGWELREIVRDVRSPTSRGTAQGMVYALERLSDQKPACLVVAELRRLSESAPELAELVRTLRERDITLLAIDAGLDTGTNEGRLAAEALISVGEVDHGAGGQTSVQNLPALREHIVAMRSSGMTLQAIADRLNTEGVPTLRGGKLWRPSSVQVALGYRRPGQGRVAGSLPKGQVRSSREWR